MRLRYKRLNLNLIDKDTSNTGSLFVCNTVDGNILFTCQSTGGSNVTIKIVNTWIPQDLSIHTKREDIINSPDFRKLVTTGDIDVLLNEDAEAIMDRDDAKREHNIVYRTGTSRPKISKRTTTTKTKNTDNTAMDVNSKVISIVNKANNKEITQQEALTILKATRMRVVDYKYVVKVSNISQLKKYGADRIVAIKEKKKKQLEANTGSVDQI